MTTYEIVDSICDAVNPLLTVAVIAYAFWPKARSIRNTLLLQMLVGVSVVYGLLFVERFWLHRAGYEAVDYSTHSAYALVFTLILMQLRSVRLYAIVVLAAYMVAMVLQGYHSIVEVVVTVLLVGVLFYGILSLLPRHGLALREIDV